MYSLAYFSHLSSTTSGSFLTATCTRCKYSVPGDDIKEDIMNEASCTSVYASQWLLVVSKLIMVFRCGGTRMMCMPCVPALQSCYSFPLNTVLAMGDACLEMHVLCRCVGVGVNEWWNVPNVLNMPWWLCITCSVMYLSVAGCPWVSKVQRWAGQSCTGEPRGGRGRRVCCDEAWHCLLRRTAAWGVPWVAAGWSLTGQSVALCCTLWHTRVAVAVCILTLTTLPSSHRLIFWLSLDHPSKWDQWHWCPVSLECADCNHECSRRSLQASLLWTLCVLTHCMPL